MLCYWIKERQLPDPKAVFVLEVMKDLIENEEWSEIKRHRAQANGEKKSSGRGGQVMKVHQAVKWTPKSAINCASRWAIAGGTQIRAVF